MNEGALGKHYRDGEVIVSKGEVGNCMFVIQEGNAEVYTVQGTKDVRLAVLGTGDFFGEMAIIDREVRSANVRALGDVRVLTVDKKTFLSRVHDDPSLAYRIMQKLSARIRELDHALTECQKTPQDAHVATR